MATLEADNTATSGQLLLVDDDLDISDMLRAYFSIHGYEIQAVEFGEDALRVCRRARPDLVLLDVNLPDLNGYEVCRQLKDDLRTSTIPVIFVSQRNRQKDKIQGLRVGGDDYITKPFNFDELRLRIQNTLVRTRYRRHVDPSTGRPSGSLIEEELKTLLLRSDWSLLYIGVDDFALFSDAYGFHNVSRIQSFVAKVLEWAVDRYGREDDFIGHVGQGDFIVITGVSGADEIAQAIRLRFRRAMEDAYRVPNEAPALLMSLSVGIVVGGHKRFSDIRTLAEAAAAARRWDRQRRK
jgi:PleD family two-component response regulator